MEFLKLDIILLMSGPMIKIGNILTMREYFNSKQNNYKTSVMAGLKKILLEMMRKRRKMLISLFMKKSERKEFQ